MTDPEDPACLARLQEIREGMESLRIEALAERRGKTFTTEETLEFIRRHGLAADSPSRQTRVESLPANTYLHKCW